MNYNRNPLFSGGVILAAATAIFYCFGAAHTGGFNREMGLNDAILERDFRQILYTGFLWFCVDILKALTWILFAANIILIPFTILLALFICRFNRHWLRKHCTALILRWRWSLWEKLGNFSSGTQKRKRLMTIFSYSFSIFFVLIGFMFLLLHYDSMGSKDASDIVARIEGGSFSSQELISIELNGELNKLFLIICGTRNCAGIDPETLVVHYFPQTSGFSFPLQKKFLMN